MTRKKMPQGIDPVAERKQERQAVRTFRKAAELVHEEHEEAWKNGNHQKQWIATLILPSNSATNALVVNLARHGSHKHLQRRANRISATLVDEHSENHLSLLMSNALARLLETDSTRRSVEDYERTFDDYIAFAGGIRIEDRFDIPTGVLNADYMVETDALDLVVELKQINHYAKAASADSYFEKLLEQGQVRNALRLSPTQVRIERDSLSVSQWNHFYRKFRPNVPGQLDKAARQLKSTSAFLPPSNRRRAYGVIMVNTGDFNLPVDLLHRLVEFHAKRKWEAGRFSHVDFVICMMMDMLKTGQHPLHGRCLVRTVEDTALAVGVHHLFDRWVRYGAAAVGAEAAFEPSGGAEEPLQLSGGVTGKIAKTG